MLKKYSILILMLVGCLNLFANKAWHKTAIATDGKRDIIPQKFISYTINFSELESALQYAPLENAINAEALMVDLPMPDGRFEKFAIYNTPVMASELAQQFPGIKTFGAQGVNNKLLHAKLDITEFGFHAMIFSNEGMCFIDPYSRANKNEYIVYYKSDYFNPEKSNFSENGVTTNDVIENSISNGKAKAGICIGTQLRTYRLAVACTGEYAVAVGGTTVAKTLSAIVTSVNRVDGLYETDLAIRLVLVGTETNVIFINASTDPFSGNNNSSTLLSESQTVINANIGSANYDIGHTFSTGGGGLANLGCVCSSGNKARGITGNANPVGDPYDIDYVAHEMGHQFGANHTFNSGLGSCSGNRSGNNAYEVGSGTSIMAYAGICGNDDIQPHSDPFFHVASFDAIVAYSNTGNGNTCASTTTTTNHPPTITTMPIAGKTIPKQTPFFLTGAATDVDGDSITYSWEEMDKGSSTTWDGGASTTTAPLFKSRPPTVSGTRYLPSLANINANFPANPNNTTGGLKGERLPTVNRTMNFKLTVRDNKNSGGGVATAGTNGCSISTPFSLNVSTLSGPFTVISPDGGEVWLGGTQQTVSWNVANTDAAPVSCAFVDILMSVDGGVTFDTVVATHVPNNGSATITVPNIPTNTTVRFLIRCSDNYFFDIGDADFQITQNSNPNPNGIFDVANSSTFSIHPNPANDFLLINGTAINETCTYQIFNILGEIIITNSIQVNSFAKAEPIDIAKLQAGVYFIQLKSDKISSAVKFIKN